MYSDITHSYLYFCIFVRLLNKHFYICTMSFEVLPPPQLMTTITATPNGALFSFPSRLNHIGGDIIRNPSDHRM